jgi:hypothetical protein
MSEKRMIDVDKLKEKIDYIATHTCYPDIVPQDCERIKNIIDSLAQPAGEKTQEDRYVELKRSEAFYKIQNNYEDEDKLDPDFLNEILDILESAGVEFAPEEPSAVEKWENEVKDYALDAKEYGADNMDELNFKGSEIKKIIELGNSMRDEQQARIADLESQVNIIADENQSLEKRIEEKDAKLSGLLWKLRYQQNIDAWRKERDEILKLSVESDSNFARKVFNFCGSSSDLISSFRTEMDLLGLHKITPELNAR